MLAAGFSWDAKEAHSAVYDTQKTAELFCKVINRWDSLNPDMRLRLAG